VFAPLWDLTSDCVLVGGSILYARARLAPSGSSFPKMHKTVSLPS
jgi:hypothetical protein